MRADLREENSYSKQKHNQQTTTATMEDMNDTTRRSMDECIAEMPKLLIWSENTYKQKKKTRMGGGG
jgi:hypothetical protein